MIGYQQVRQTPVLYSEANFSFYAPPTVGALNNTVIRPSVRLFVCSMPIAQQC